ASRGDLLRSTWSTGLCSGRSSGTSAVPRIADDFVHRASRQRWAKRVNCIAAIFAPARRGRDMRFFARPAHVRIFRVATGVPTVLYRDRPPGSRLLASEGRSGVRPRYPLAIGMASGSIAIYTKYVFTPPWPTPIRPYFRPSGSTE